MRKLLFLFVLGLTAVLSASAEESRAGRTEIGGGVSAMPSGGDLEWDSAHLFGKVFLDHSFNERLSGELGLAAGKVDVKDERDAHLLIPTAELHYHLPDAGSLQPFLAGGVGMMQPVDGPSKTAPRLILPVGAGLKIPLNDKFSGRLDARWMPGTDFDGIQTAGAFTGGISYLFGSAAGPAAVAVTGRGKAAARSRELTPGPKESSINWNSAVKREIPPPIGEPPIQTKPKLLIQFRPYRSKIGPRYMPPIVQFAEFLRKNPKSSATIEGHEDSWEARKDPVALSKLRAAVVRREILSSARLHPSRVTSRGLGAARPIGKNKTEKGRELNRRVVGKIKFPPPLKVKPNGKKAAAHRPRRAGN